MWTPEYFVRYVELPLKVDGVTVPNDDGTFDIYINVLHPEAHQRECLEHEVWHITHDHFYNEQPVSDCERDAKKAAKAASPKTSDKVSIWTSTAREATISCGAPCNCYAISCD